MKKTRKLLLKLGLTMSILGAAFTMGFKNAEPLHSIAQTTKEEASLRFIFTTDLHGQLNSVSYETGLDYNNGGLSRAYDLIVQARNEVPTDNSFTFDVGDFLYDYTTEYIFSENQNEIQPIVKAMAMVGYDAITLGNHEFDYGYNYLINQLNGSGLMDITVVSNVWDAKTNKHRFHENMLITREVETSSGKKAEVKVGIIGETIPTLTAKTESYVGLLKTEDIVANVKAQSAKLKAQGADVIVVLAHSGFGPVNPELNFKNVAYALTKIDDVDVILCGHEHNEFPTTDKSSAYLSMPGVDKTTFLVNDKNIVMASHRGQSIGLVDLVLDLSDKVIEIIDRKSSLRYVKDYKTTENEAMKSLYGAWETEFLKYSGEKIGKTGPNESINNFFGLFQDTTSIQLLNDAKRDHALRYINTEAKQYKDYPVVAVSSYYSYGANSYEDFVNIKNSFSESDLAILQPYNNYLYLYTATGAQLKEWLEWSASAYESTIDSAKWNNATMSDLMKTTNLRSLIKEEWLADWNNFYIFDGVDYSINITMQPRYDLSGNKISNSTRVRDLTYNGKNVTDDMKFIIASNKLTVPGAANKPIENNHIYKAFFRSQSVLSDYIQQISKVGNIVPTPDFNWKLQVPDKYQFIVNGPTTATSLAKKSDWMVKELKTVDNYTYYVAEYKVNNEDTIAPNLYLVPTVIAPTGSGYDVVVDAIDASGIKTVKYLEGEYELGDDKWTNASVVKDGIFSAKKNGIYSVYAEDNKGNKVVKQVVIDNISDKVVRAPKIETYTNRKASIKGVAEPEVTVVITVDSGTYEAKADKNGNFSYPLPAQKAGSKVSVYAKDKDTGRVSSTVTMNIKRTGPNQPSVDHIYNNSEYISGFMNDDATIIAMIDGVVYVAKDGGKETYLNAKDIYDPNKIIEEVDLTIKNGKFILDIRPQRPGTAVTLYNIDHVFRNSRVVNMKVTEAGPNVPVVYEVLNVEKSITGSVTSSAKNQIFEVYAEINGKIYTGQTDKAGKFTLPFTENLKVGQSILVYASDTVGGAVRKSAKAEIIVENIDDYIDADDSILYLDGITNKETDGQGGYYEGDSTVYIAPVSSRDQSSNELIEVITDGSGDFSYTLENPLPAGSSIYAITRFKDGGVIGVNRIKVIPEAPEMPILIEDMNNSDKEVYVIADEESEVTIKIGKKTYTSTTYEYSEEYEAYVYKVTIGRTNSGTKATVQASNVSGSSKVLSTVIGKKAPDAPKVDKVTIASTSVTGTIELLGEKVKDTVVYVKIGTKTYKGAVKEDGTFEVKIKKQKEKTKMTVWGTYQKARGPQVTVQVVKK